MSPIRSHAMLEFSNFEKDLQAFEPGSVRLMPRRRGNGTSRQGNAGPHGRNRETRASIRSLRAETVRQILIQARAA